MQLCFLHKEETGSVVELSYILQVLYYMLYSHLKHTLFTITINNNFSDTFSDKILQIIYIFYSLGLVRNTVTWWIRQHSRHGFFSVSWDPWWSDALLAVPCAGSEALFCVQWGLESVWLVKEAPSSASVIRTGIGYWWWHQFIWEYQSLGSNEVFWGDGKVFEIQSTIHVHSFFVCVSLLSSELNL